MMNKQLSPAEILAQLPESERQAWLASLTDETKAQLAYFWPFWARPNQLAPDWQWFVWLILSGRGWGKMLDIETPIPTPTGWKRMGDMQAGDELFDESGRICRVKIAHDIETPEKAYRVNFSDGTHINACADHQWVTWTHRDRKNYQRNRSRNRFPDDWAARLPITTEQIAQTQFYGKRNDRNHCIPNALPLQLPNRDLPIDPWLFGYWIGNGRYNQPELTCGSKDGDFDTNYVSFRLKLLGIDHSIYQDNRNKCATVRMLNGSFVAPDSKLIPSQYLRSSESQRLNLLQGLMDSDGYPGERGEKVEFCSTDKILACQVYELVVSLGERCTMLEGRATLNGKDCGSKYRVIWRPSICNPFSLPRKALKVSFDGSQRLRLRHRMIVSVDPIEPMPMRCLTVDSENSMYLAGKQMVPTHNTETGANWVKDRVKNGARSIALVAETQKDLEEVMVPRILKVHPESERPTVRYKPVRVEWPNGAIALGYNGTEPDQLRGPEFDTAWIDELAKYRYAREAWDMLQFTMRKGNDPRIIVTTTPRPIPLIRELIASKSTHVTRGSTFENASNLAERALQELKNKYEGTRLGRQELAGEILDDLPGALWTRDTFDKHRIERDKLPELTRIVVAVDPSGTKGDSDDGDEIGIIAAGKGVDGRGYLLADRTCKLSPDGWGCQAVKLYHELSANALVAERNFGGAMVEHVIKSIDRKVAYREVTASRGKVARAEPIAAMYEQGKISHVGEFDALEDQMSLFGPDGYIGEKSPDRADAAVWAFTDLFFGKSKGYTFEDLKRALR